MLAALVITNPINDRAPLMSINEQMCNVHYKILLLFIGMVDESPHWTMVSFSLLNALYYFHLN